MTKRVDIIGAGISGLATAYYLAKSGEPLEIHLWEQSTDPGGLAGVFRTEHYTVEKFYHHLFRRDVALTALIEELGLGAELDWRPASTGAYYDNRPYRLSSPLDLLRYKPLPFVDRLRLGWLALHARRYDDWRQLDDVTVRKYVTDVAGERVYRTIWEPLFRGKFGPYADEISAAWLWSKLRDRGSSRSTGGREVLGYVRGGLGRVFRAMVDHLLAAGHHVHFNVPVTGFLVGGNGRVDAISTGAGLQQTDCVVSAVQVPDLAALLPDSLADLRSSLREIAFLGNVCLVLTLRQSLSEFYWTNVNDVTLPFVGIIEQTRWADRDAFAGKHVVYISAYVTSDDERMDMGADQLVRFYLPHIQRMFPAFSESAIEARACWKAPYAQPIVRVGYRHLIPALNPFGNLFVCTMAQIYPNDRQVSNGVEMAAKTADAVVAKLRRG